ncbi:FKBP-type peptidyl-prolyl cis-trans isomerase [Rubrivirga sp.]|uniref:FKBP-type peptidyl-prolyl cis-trans isomerase n=1 Tax=Rubrivirga sp. TaxID=1885344 RepID=UPI003C736627
MPVQSGNQIRVHYTGTLADGSEFDSSRGRDPLAFTAGAGQVVPGFDAAVMGLEPGETKVVTIPAAQAYGEADPEKTLIVPRDQMPDGEISLGDQLQLGLEGGGAVIVTVAELDDDSVTLDANHALAGEDLTFEITLVEIEA